MTSKKINIGLDIGVASVGWSLLDENAEIIDIGVRLFDDPAKGDGTLANAKRRSMRSLRRMIRRRKLRKKDLVYFLIQNKFGSESEIYNCIENFDISKHGKNFVHPAQLKVKALKERITKEELIFLLFHYIHHRGYFFLTDKDVADGKKINSDNHKYPSEQMVNFFNKNKYFAYTNINGEQFSNKDWVEEIKKVLKTQECSDEIINKYLEIFSRVREFALGPGGKKSPTPYGLYRNKWDSKQKRFIVTNQIDGNKTAKSLWDYTIGKCSWFKEENRGYKNSPVAELFNLFNDLNNIYFFNNHELKLTKQDKEDIFCELSLSFTQKKSDIHLNKKLICKIYNKNHYGQEELLIDDVYGNRVKHSNGAKAVDLFTKLENFYVIGKWLAIHSNEFCESKNINCLNIDFLKKCNDFFEELAKEQDFNKRVEFFKKTDEVNKLSSPEEYLNNVKKIKGLSSSHSLSNKAMLLFIEDCIKYMDKSENQQQFYAKNIRMFNSASNVLNKAKYIQHNLFKDEILSPTVKKAFNQAILVFNKILKIYSKKYDIDNIVFELPRDKNTAEQSKYINYLLKRNEEIIRKALDGEENLDLKSLSPHQKIRLKLWYSQNKKDIYDNAVINIKQCLNGENLHVDHIIPVSISSDNSWDNKVLTKNFNNSDKSNRTPYQWLSSRGYYEKFKERVDKLFSDGLITLNKRRNLLFESEPMNNLMNFIGRNLSDTRYAAMLVLHKFQDFFDNNPNYKNVKIKVVRGAITNFARYNLFVNNRDGETKSYLPKDRDLYCHHAIDAAIVCYLGMNHDITKVLSYYQSKIYGNNPFEYDKEKKQLCNKETGEVIDFAKYYFYNKEDIDNFGSKLAQYNDSIKYGIKNKVRFSRGITTKNNISFANETIYSFGEWKDDTKKEYSYYDKIDLINSKKKDLDKYFLDKENKKSERLLVWDKDERLFKKLKQIYFEYSNISKKSKSINPFIQYMKDEYDLTDVKFIKIDNQIIKKLRRVNFAKSEPLFLRKHENKAIQISLMCISWRIYQTIDDKFVILPLNINVFDRLEKNKILLSDKKINDKKLNFKIKNNKYFDLKRGQILLSKKDHNDIFYVSGCVPAQNKIEIKWLKGKNTKHPEYKERKQDQLQIDINQIASNYLFAQVDPLGNVWDKKDLSYYF